MEEAVAQALFAHHFKFAVKQPIMYASLQPAQYVPNYILRKFERAKEIFGLFISQDFYKGQTENSNLL